VIDSQDITSRVLDRCRGLDFVLAGVTDARPTQYEAELFDWLSAGKHGEMEYLRRNVELRVDPRKMVEGAKSIICVADRYWSEKTESGDFTVAGGNPQPRGRIARYARGDDYHIVMKKRLHILCNELGAMFSNEVFRDCVDTAPLLEREHAQRAGLGAVGKNTLLIERGVGSYLLLGEIITTLALDLTAPSAADPCSTCTRCIDACPTQAITPWSVDATRCISYLTIEHRGLIDEKYHEAMGDWIFGCDICQEVCPHNQPTARSRERPPETHSAYAARRNGFDLLEVLNWDEEVRRETFIRSSMKRARLDMMKRNALIAAGNAIRGAENTALYRRMEELRDDPSESQMVRETARVVLRNLRRSTPVA